MRKQIALLIIATTLCATAARAQAPNRKTLTVPAAHLAKVRGMVMPTAPNRAKAQARTTDEVAERLVALTDYYYKDTIPLTISDSSHFSYSGDRSSIFNYNIMAFDNYYLIDGAFLMGFIPGWGRPDHNNQPSILCDTTKMWSGDTASSTGLTYFDTRYFLYDTVSHITEYADLFLMDVTTSYFNNKYVNFFTANNLTSSIGLSWDFGVWDTSEYRFLFYDTYNRVTMDSTNLYTFGFSSPYEKWNDSYDGSGNLTRAKYYTYDGTTWGLTEQYDMAYNSDNSLRMDSISQWNSGVSLMQPVLTDYLDYTPGISYAMQITEYRYNVGILYVRDVTTKHVSGIGLPDTMYQVEYSGSGGMVTKGRTSYMYDAYDEPILATSYGYVITDTTTGAGYYDTTMNLQSHYYYETFLRHTASVPAQTQSTQLSVQVYPNPTKDMVNISIANLQRGTSVSLKLIDAAGRALRAIELPWQGAVEAVDMKGLVPGTYWLLVQAGGKDVGRQMVVKE